MIYRIFCIMINVMFTQDQNGKMLFLVPFKTVTREVKSLEI